MVRRDHARPSGGTRSTLVDVDRKQYKIPATIDDPRILAEVEAALQRLGYARAAAAK